MADKEKDAGWLSSLGVTIHDLLRYGYGGLLAFLVAALISPDDTKKVIEALTGTIAAIVAFALGGAIYALQRPLSEPIHWIRELFHRWLNSFRKGHFCRSAYFKHEYNIPFYLQSDAFRVVRDELFNIELQKRFYRQHSELHTLYVSFWVLLTAAFVVWINDPPGRLSSGWAFFIAAMIALVAGMFGDILLCQQECKHMLTLDPRKIKDQVEKTEFVQVIQPAHTDHSIN